jgi:hypothetical protein
MTLSKLHNLQSVEIKNDHGLFRRSTRGLLKILSQHPPVVDGSKCHKLNCSIRHKAEATIGKLKTSSCFHMEQVCEILEDVSTLQSVCIMESVE